MSLDALTQWDTPALPEALSRSGGSGWRRAHTRQSLLQHLHMRNKSALTEPSPQPPSLPNVAVPLQTHSSRKGLHGEQVPWAGSVRKGCVVGTQKGNFFGYTLSSTVTLDTFQQGLKVQRGGCMKAMGSWVQEQRLLLKLMLLLLGT